MKKGLTLVETIVAIGLTVLIITSAFSLYFLSQKTYKISLLKMEVGQNARIALERMSREIRQTPLIITSLPLEESQAVSEIFFQDGHEKEKIRYISYYQDGLNLKRKVIHYYFPSEPDNWVVYGAVDAQGNPALTSIDEDTVIAENISYLGFYGEKLVNIKLKAEKGEKKIELKTSILSRNL